MPIARLLSGLRDDLRIRQLLKTVTAADARGDVLLVEPLSEDVAFCLDTNQRTVAASPRQRVGSPD
jgi:hypothetical protein